MKKEADKLEHHFKLSTVLNLLWMQPTVQSPSAVEHTSVKHKKKTWGEKTTTVVLLHKSFLPSHSHHYGGPRFILEF